MSLVNSIYFYKDTKMANNFSIYVGIAVEDKPLDSREIKVYIRELIPYSGGKLEDTTRTETYSIKNDQDATISGNVDTTNCIIADYFGVETNRAFPPDIVKGEQVLVFRYSDEDRYYWVCAGRDDNLRRGELHRIQISDDMHIVKELTEHNTYFLEMDTKVAKRIRIETSKSDGEDFEYRIIIDAKNDFVQITDDIGNRMEIFSKPKRVKLTNAVGATVDLLKEDIFILAPRDIHVKAGRFLFLSDTIVHNSYRNMSGTIHSFNVNDNINYGE